MNIEQNNSEIILKAINIIVPSLAALTGVLIGSHLQSKAQFRNWLRSKRAEIFTDFLNSLELCYKKAEEHLTNPFYEDGVTAYDVPSMYNDTYNNMNIVKLFLKKKSRKKFKDTVNKYIGLHSKRDLGLSRYVEMYHKRKEIETIFINNLENPNW